MARSSLGSRCNFLISDGGSERLAVKSIIQVKCGFAGAQQQVAPRRKPAVQLRQDFLAGREVEIDEHITAEHEIERTQSGHTMPQIQLLKTHHAADLILELPLEPDALKILHQEGSRQSTI